MERRRCLPKALQDGKDTRMNPNVEYLNRLLGYDRWANREALESIRDTKLHRSRKLFGHIVSAEWMWLSRLKQTDYAGVTWPEWSFEECDEQLQSVDSAWSDCIAGVAEDGAVRRVQSKHGETTTIALRPIGRRVEHLAAVARPPEPRGEDFRAEGEGRDRGAPEHVERMVTPPGQCGTVHIGRPGEV